MYVLCIHISELRELINALPITKRFPCLGESCSHFSAWVIYSTHFIKEHVYLIIVIVFKFDWYTLIICINWPKKALIMTIWVEGSSAFFWEFACWMYFLVLYRLPMHYIQFFFYLCSPYALHAKTNYLIVSCIESNGLDKSKLPFSISMGFIKIHYYVKTTL